MAPTAGSRCGTLPLPCLKSTIIILTLMNLGNIFRSDFGLFYQVPMIPAPCKM